jgi:hypothetical protein
MDQAPPQTQYNLAPQMPSTTTCPGLRRVRNTQKQTIATQQ